MVAFKPLPSRVQNLSPSLSSLGQQTGWRARTVTTNQVPLYSLSQPISVPQVCGWFSGFPSPNWSGLNKRQSQRVGGSPAQANSTWPWGAITLEQSVWHTHTHTHTHTQSSQNLPITTVHTLHQRSWMPPQLPVSYTGKVTTHTHTHTHTHTNINKYTERQWRNLLM